MSVPVHSEEPEVDIEADLPLEGNFVEQAEYIPENIFTALSADHPDEETIIRRLSAGGAKLLVGPRGCGKTTLMLKTYYGLLRKASQNFGVYVNFKLSLKLEPLYVNTPNATYWFRLWLNLKIYEGVHSALELAQRFSLPKTLPSRQVIESLLASIEAGKVEQARDLEQYTMDGLSRSIGAVLEENGLSRCVLLLDDAAHAFSSSQQEDFFEFFRQIKSREISPKAAIYPGITTHSPTFHVGHDAEQIDVWIRPDQSGYVDFMRSLATKRFNGNLPSSLANTPLAVDFLAFAAFGNPRSFLNMLRTIYHDEMKITTASAAVDRRKLLDISKQTRELSHNVYDSLTAKVPAYREFIETGRDFYQGILARIKDFNRGKEDDEQALEVALKKPITGEIAKILSFFQYAGLLLPAGENSRGVKGSFELYFVHFGDLITDNAIIGRRTKSIPAFVKAFSAQTHQAWPRVTPESLIRKPKEVSFRLVLPHCQVCGAERASEHAKFCHSCGSQLKATSLYDSLTNQDISVLPLSRKMVSRIKAHSNIRTIKDILIDSDRLKLRGIPQIGPARARRIATYAEEYVA